MFKKIVFLCVNQWEQFLPSVFRERTREYYRWACEQAALMEENLYCREEIGVYGEPDMFRTVKLFHKDETILQILYLQSNQKELLEKVFLTADMVFVGLSGCKKECDQILLMVLPWKERIVFLWDESICDRPFLQRLKREYGLKDSQIVEIKKPPSYLTEALIRSFL